MSTRIAINGFGRIGRMVFRRAIEMGVDVIAINGTASPKDLAHLVRYDSIHGFWDVPIEVKDNTWIVNGQTITLFSTREPKNLPWGDLDIDVVVESTGKFRTYDTAAVHLEQGAKRVLITAPAKGDPGADLTMVMGVNHQQFSPSVHHVISGASCTTNALAPVVQVLNDAFGIESGLMTTIHSYTNDQKNLDNPHKDLRRARACGQSLIPTSTGAARAMGEVLPEMRGKLNGIAIRVPTPNVSMIDLVVNLEKSVTKEEINTALERAAQTSHRGILSYTDAPLVSIDFNGNPHSSIIDADSTMIINERTAKILAWYDNEWGYSCRMVDTVIHMAEVVAKHEKRQIKKSS